MYIITGVYILYTRIWVYMYTYICIYKIYMYKCTYIFFFFLKIYLLFIYFYFWLCWVSVAAHRVFVEARALRCAAKCEGFSLVVACGLSSCGVRA